MKHRNLYAALLLATAAALPQSAPAQASEIEGQQAQSSDVVIPKLEDVVSAKPEIAVMGAGSQTPGALFVRQGRSAAIIPNKEGKYEIVPLKRTGMIGDPNFVPASAALMANVKDMCYSDKVVDYEQDQSLKDLIKNKGVQEFKSRWTKFCKQVPTI